MNLNNLPDITFADADEESVKTAVIESYEAIAGRKLADGDPIRLFLLSIANLLIVQRNLIDFTGKMNLLAYASGNYLDHLGALLDVARIEPEAAETTVKFTISMERDGATVIPAGTRITDAEEKAYFAVDSDTEIPAGSREGTVHATCITPGEGGNGFAIGTLNKLVDPLPYVDSVSNTTVSAGGNDEESDESYRERIHEAPESFSNAGSIGAYAYFAKSANADIIDVSITSPTPGEVLIVPLMEGGNAPEQEVLDDVLKACNEQKVRPLTDKVTTKAPTTVGYNIEATYYLDTDDRARATAIQDEVDKAVQEYVLWQKSRLGRDLDPSKLYELMVGAGAKKVSVTSPVLTTLQRTEIAKEETVNVVYKGVEDE